MTKEEKYISNWEKTIKKGKTVYILKIAIFWSVATTIITPFFYMLFDWDFSEQAFAKEFATKQIIMSFTILSFFGIFLGNQAWNRGMKKYNIIIDYLNNK